MSKVTSRQARPPLSGTAIDITGHENCMLLLANPGDELAYGPFIAELCARGRPPFVVILGDGAREGSHALATLCERRSRAAFAILGVPDDRILFVGLRMGSIPDEGAALFETLLEAMALLNWRKDCNVVAARDATDQEGDHRAAWQVARALACRGGLRLVLRLEDTAGPGSEADCAFDGSAWRAVAARAYSKHRDAQNQTGEIETRSRFRCVPPDARHGVNLEGTPP